MRLISALVSGAVYLGLAILGWGGVSAFFSHPPLAALTVALFVVCVAAAFVGGNLSPGEREDRANRWVLPVFAVIGLLDGYVPAYSDRTELWTLDGDALRWVGIVLFLIGCAVRLWPVYVLGNRFSGLVAIQPGHTLVTTGIYSAIRNPSYLGLLIGTLGWGLAFRSGLGVLLAALLLLPLIARIHAEERLLASQFGDAYRSYCARTARLIPGIY